MWQFARYLVVSEFFVTRKWCAAAAAARALYDIPDMSARQICEKAMKIAAGSSKWAGGAWHLRQVLCCFAFR